MTPHGFRHRFRRLLIALTAFVRLRAALIAVAALLLVVGSTYYLARAFAVNTDTTEMLSPELPFLAYARAEKAAFPHNRDVLVVVIDAPAPLAAEQAGQALAFRLRQQPELFGEVFYPQGDPFFRRNGFLFLDTPALQALAADLLRGQPFLGAVAADPSLRGLAAVLGLAVEHAAEGGDDLARMLAALAEASAAPGGAPFSLRDSGAAQPSLGLDQRRQLIVLRPALDFASTQPAAKPMRMVRAIAAELALAERFGARVRMTGDAALDSEELASVESGTTLATVISLVLVIALLWLCFHSVRLIVIMLVTVIAGLILTGAFAAATVGAFNIISLTFAVLYIGLGADFSIHYTLRYLQALGAGAGDAQAWRQTARDIGGPLTLSAVSAAIGFAAFVPTDYRGLAELGLIASAGMVIALICNLTLLPALITLWPPPPPAFSGAMRRFAQRFSHWVAGRDRAILVAATAIALASIAAMPLLIFDADPLNLKDPDSEAVATLFDLRRDGWDNRYVISAVADSLEDARRLAEQARGLAEVGATRTILDFVPHDQDEKLAIIDQLALILEPALARAPRPAASLDDNQAALARLQARLAASAAAGNDAVAQAAGRLAAALAPYTAADASPEALKRLQDRLIGGLVLDIAGLRAALTAEPVTLESLPAGVRARWLTADGRARLEIEPKADIHGDQAALRAFVEAVAAAVPRAAGEPVLILGARDAILAAFLIAAVVSLAAIGGLLVLVMKPLRDVAFVFAPILWAAVVTIGIAVVLGLPFNLANIIALPLLFGLGVAGSVQFVIRTRTEQGTRAALNSSTPRAVVFSFLTAISSFGSLGVVSHPGIATMGILLTIALSIALLSTLIMLPALMHWAGRRWAP